MRWLLAVLWAASVLVVANGRAAAATVVALAPLGTLTEGPGGVVEATLVAALGAVPDTTVLPPARVRTALRDAHRRDLESCEGEARCLAELGRLVGATIVVAGELAGLADGQVVYLKAVDVAGRVELRSTTLVLRAHVDAAAAARAAAMRLLAPDAYVGTLEVKIEVEGAEVFIDGRAAGRAPLPALELAVGTHALRVTHPRFRDFVRFVEVGFGERTEVRATLADFDVGVSTLHARGAEPAARRWYHSPWALAGFGVAVAAVAVVVALAIPHEVAHDKQVTVHDP